MKEGKTTKTMKKESNQTLSIYDIASIIHTTPAYARDLVKSGLINASNTGKIAVSLDDFIRFLNVNAGMNLNDPFNPKPLLKN